MARRTKDSPRPPRVPYPCTTPGCAGVLVGVDEMGLVTDPEREGAAAWVCLREQGEPAPGSSPVGCGFTVSAGTAADASERCPADGGPLTFDAELVGETCGNLRRRGWNRCAHCGGVWVTRRGASDDGRGKAWRIATSGVSLDAGGVRLRAEGKGSRDGTAALMARIARLPELEEALHLIADGMNRGDAIALARRMLAIDDANDEGA